MKQKIYILGLVTAMIVFLGTLFKVNHWPGAGILLMSGILILVFVFLPLALVNSFKAEGNKSNRLLYIVTWLTALVVFIAMLFKVQHWSWGGYLMLVSIPFPFLVFLPVFLLVTSRNKEHNIYTTVYMLFFLVILSCFTVLLALNVSKEKIAESLGIARNYTTAEKAADNLTVRHQSSIDQKIDELISLTEQYRSLYLEYYGITDVQWKSDPEVFLISGAYGKSARRFDDQEGTINMNLLSGFRDLIKLLEETPGCENLASAAPSVFSLRKTGSGDYNWDSVLILYPFQPWLMIHFDGLETNLKMIRAIIE